MIETRLLHYFLTVAKEQNITNAAKILHITQPTLSRQMALLEEEIGVKLFLRGSRPLTLTNEGLLLRRRAEEILELVEKTEEELSAQEEQIEGTISIGCGELASVKLLTEAIADFHGKYPRVVFDVYTANADQIKSRMDEGLTDIGLLLEPAETERYEYIRMPIKERWAAVMPSGVPLAKREYVTAEDLADIPVIMPSRQKVHNEVANWFGNYYEKLKMTGVSNLSTNAALLVRAGVGYALIVEGALPFLECSEVCMLPLYPELTATSILAWKRQQPFSAATVRFLEHMKCFLGMTEG
ncbi:LysR family transcriptional regulator [Ruminococcus sp. 5_1_39BFAA]|uniref:LysR family transcriptional regulator n=1 Tax=Ruminococcus sp. 5_1_39BFAA TaxID=457412 RepID=UPI0035686EE1